MIASATFGQVQFGMKAGLNYNIMDLTIVDDDDFTDEEIDRLEDQRSNGSGYNLGGFATFPGERARLRMELVYSSRAYSTSTEYSYDHGYGSPTHWTAIETDVQIQQKYRLTYLELPILLEIQISNGFFIHMGPSFGYRTDWYLKEELEGTTVTTVTVNGFVDDKQTTNFAESETSRNDGQVRNLEVGALLGVGYQLPNGLSFSLRYQRGLTPMNRAKGYVGYYTGGLHSADYVRYFQNNLQFAVGFTFLR